MKTDIIKRNPDVIFTEFNEDLILLNPNNGKYIKINKSASEIWNLTDKPISLNKLLTELSKIYNEDIYIIENDTKDFLNRAIKVDIIKLC